MNEKEAHLEWIKDFMQQEGSSWFENDKANFIEMMKLQYDFNPIDFESKNNYMTFSVLDKMHKKVNNNELTIDQYIDNLVYYIENCKNPIWRAFGVRYLRFAKSSKPNVFRILERCVIEDEIPIVRIFAMEGIAYLFPEKIPMMITHLINYEENPEVLIIALSILRKDYKIELELKEKR